MSLDMVLVLDLTLIQEEKVLEEMVLEDKVLEERGLEERVLVDLVLYLILVLEEMALWLVHIYQPASQERLFLVLEVMDI